MPRLQVMYDDYGENGFVPVTINLWESVDIVKAYARQYDNPYLIDNGSVWGTYQQTGRIPLNYIISPDGVIRYIEEGFSETTIRQVIMQWLPGPIEHDVSVRAILAPSGTVDSGTVVVPACSVFNYGPDPETYPVRVRVGTMFDTVATVSGHQPGQSVYVEFPEWIASERGQIAVTCSTELATDDVPNNDKMTGSVRVHSYDLALIAILVPVDTVDSGAAVVPMVEVGNYGTVADMARVKLFIGGSYIDSVNVPLQPGRTDTAAFDAWIPMELGEHAVRCTVSGRWDMFPENNLLTGSVWVRSSTGIEEDVRVGAARRPPTMVSGVLHAPEMTGTERPAVLLDISGRQVMDLVPGANDVRHLSPGVYYVRDKNTGASLKVVLQQ
ncbi:MAG: hypothetical protein JSU73_12765 [candidate division WOR-3 bacterium]|nr:MAG: hypothetical protein JSU73_12765 [candidate division WOR-3 bacterium]